MYKQKSFWKTGNKSKDANNALLSSLKGAGVTVVSTLALTLNGARALDDNFRLTADKIMAAS